MAQRFRARVSGLGVLAPVAFAVALFCCPARSAFAVSCAVVHHSPLSDADKALLTADYTKAESLYRSALAANPGDADLTEGLVHALLREQKVQEAADTVKAALDAAPKSAALITLRGEVELRQGEPWTAAQTANDSVKLDPCSPRTQLLIADLARINSLYATARQSLLNAHQLDPDDPEIREEWLFTLPLKQRIAELEAYLAAPQGDDADELRRLHQYLDHMRRQEAEPPRPCRLVSQSDTAEIPFVLLMRDATHIRGFGLDVKLNDHSAHLQIDTGAGGLVISRSVANHAGLKAFSQNEVGGIGDEGLRAGHTAYADSIQIGNLEFQNCQVEVVDKGMGDADGLIGMNVFSRFLVTLDYPMRKLLLAPLPPRPSEQAAAPQKLNTGGEDEGSDETQAPPAGQAGSVASSPAAAAAKPAPHGPYDRYIAPEMKDYTEVYRVGQYLILPTGLNFSKIKLFILDTGAWTTTISPPAAREVTKVHSGAPVQVRGLNGEVQKVYSADEITFRFANLAQKVDDVIAFDTSKISKDSGIEISGFLGAATLRQLTIHIDYRDGLVKFDYDPKRGYRY
jgi:predicted aspartyl protease/cytochrome c-type biogenesis protein CcmH/NrfG